MTHLTHDLASDAAFDRYLPEPLRLASAQHWTPLAVIARLAAWVDELGLASVVDLGSGAGKVCVAGACLSRARWHGLEQRPHLVSAARALALVFGVEDRATFGVAHLERDPIPAADGYYLFNPFEEFLHGRNDHIDERTDLAPERYLHGVTAVERLLAAAPMGTCVFAYIRFGGLLLDDYELIREDLSLPHPLRAWRKLDRPARSAFYAGDEPDP